MTIWLVRAGRYGEQEDFALQNYLSVIGWADLPDLSEIKKREDLFVLLQQHYLDEKLKIRSNWESQIWRFLSEMRKGDLVAMPLKHRAIICFGEVSGDYKYESEFSEGYRHTRPVTWKWEIPRNRFDQDLLYSFGSGMTICQISRNDAEKRINAVLQNKPIPGIGDHKLVENGEEGNLDFGQITRDQISKTIMQKFKGHGLTRLTAAVLQAQGYQVRLSPEGPDGSVDIIAGRGQLGFESPQMVV